MLKFSDCSFLGNKLWFASWSYCNENTCQRMDNILSINPWCWYCWFGYLHMCTDQWRSHHYQSARFPTWYCHLLYLPIKIIINFYQFKRPFSFTFSRPPFSVLQKQTQSKAIATKYIIVYFWFHSIGERPEAMQTGTSTYIANNTIQTILIGIIISTFNLFQNFYTNLLFSNALLDKLTWQTNRILPKFVAQTASILRRTQFGLVVLNERW